MPHLFRNKENKKLYTIYISYEWAAGVYAYPYKWFGESICYLLWSQTGPYEPETFVEDNFEPVAELYSLF
jgi:hypothetical protein